MSIYSGFATRAQENYYDQVLYNVLSTLLVRVMKFYKGESIQEESFLQTVSNQEKCLRKLERRKYLDPKYAELLEHFLASVLGNEIKKAPEHYHMNRTLSGLDKHFHEIRNMNENLFEDKAEGHSLSKIQEKVKKGRKKSKQKKGSIKSNLDVWDFKAESKPPQLPSLQPLEHRLTKTKFNTRTDFSSIPSKQVSDYDEYSGQKQIEQRKALVKPPKFRARMFFNERQNETRVRKT